MRKGLIFGGLLLISVLSVTIGSAKIYYIGNTYKMYGVWNAGTTGLFGDGEVYSEFTRLEAIKSKATVINARGLTVTSDWTTAGTSKARATAYLFGADYSYYDYQ